MSATIDDYTVVLNRKGNRRSFFILTGTGFTNTMSIKSVVVDGTEWEVSNQGNHATKFLSSTQFFVAVRKGNSAALTAPTDLPTGLTLTDEDGDGTMTITIEDGSTDPPKKDLPIYMIEED